MNMTSSSSGLSSGESGSQCWASWSEEDSSLPPIFLRQLSRSPKEILQKKAELGLRATRGLELSAGDGKEDLPVRSGSFLEWEIHLRLFYIHCLSSLRTEGFRETMEELGERYQNRDWKLGLAREELARLMDQKLQLEEMVKTLRQDQDCLSSLIQQDDQTALQALSKLQSQLQDAEFRVAEVAKEVGASNPASSFRRVFPSPSFKLPDLSKPPPSCTTAFLHQTPVLSSPPPILSSPPTVHSGPAPILSSPPCPLSSPLPIPSFLQFTNLFSLSGQLADLCQGEHGSKFVVDRLRVGGQPERGLVRTELGLPGNLTKHLASPYCMDVVRTLIQVDDTARQELEEEARSQEEAIRATEGGARILANMFSIT